MNAAIDYPTVQTLDDGQKVIVLCNQICRLVGHGRDKAVTSPPGFFAGRVGCDCTAIWVLPDGTCNCAPGEKGMPATLKKAKE